MAIDTTPSTVATSALQAIPFSSLIGGPLDAAISAQAQAAKTSWEFIQNVGLNTNPDTGMREAINVTFFYNNGGHMSKLIVPLLTIVPIPYIAVDTININFLANISAASSSVSSTSTEENLGGEAAVSTKIGWGPFSVTADFKANYSSKKDSKASEESKYSVEYTMNVEVNASQSDMPAGLASVLNILQSSITEGNDGGQFEFSNVIINDQDLDASGAFDFNVKITVKDGNGLYVKNKDFEVNLVNAAPTGVTFTTTFPSTITTNKNGVATLNLQGSVTGNSGDQVSETIPMTISETGGDLSDTFDLLVSAKVK